LGRPWSRDEADDERIRPWGSPLARRFGGRRWCNPLFEARMIQILQGDCREVLKTLPDCSVHCCVTSPPYFGLRDYGTAKWEGGDADCDHIEMAIGMSEKNTLGPSGHLPSSNAANVGRKIQYRNICARCGARRVDCQIGLESTPDAYVAELVAVFSEVKRVLRDDGVLFLNLGDSYYHTNPSGPQGKTGDRASRWSQALKPKDLIGIPWRVAFALQADGWYLRQDIIWHKPNPMPESVTDRCTKAHEYIFLLAKSPRYYYDAEAIKEDVAESQVGRVRDDVIGGNKGDDVHHSPGGRYSKGRGGRNAFRGQGHFRYGENGPANRAGRNMKDIAAGEDKRNRRSVWTVTTKPYREAHFATFPPDLIQPCIRAGCPAGGTVLDPFGGSGTTGEVAASEGRKAILIELNPQYVKLAQGRGGLFCASNPRCAE